MHWVVVVLVVGILFFVGASHSVGATAAPILLVVNDGGSSPYGRYLGEILRAEGLNLYEVKDLSAVVAGDLNSHDLVILAETGLSSGQATLFNDYVTGGGRLLAMRPDSQIAGLFGLGAASGSQSNGYLGIDANATVAGEQPGAGLTAETLQIHGTADRYALGSGGVMVAQLYSNATSGTGNPAVVSNSSGRAVAFTYDLARNVIYTRQGNPANANVDVDGDGVFRTIDLFQGANGGAPWVDRDKIHLPQADIQQRLFARLVKRMVGQVKPLPQVWYFPGMAKTMLVLTGDAHANPTNFYQQQIDSLTARGAASTFFLTIAQDPDDATMQNWRTQGYEFGIHPYASRPDPNPALNIANLAEGYTVFSNWYASRFTSPPSGVVRNHQVAWQGWTDGAAIASQNGYEMDANFYHYGAWLRAADGSWPHGYITGSGQPMKFVAADGTILPLYQQLTNLVDEQMVAGDALEQLSPSEAISVSQQLMGSSLAGDYAALMAQLHVDYYFPGGGQTWGEGMIDHANSVGLPIWSAQDWLDFTKLRNGAEFTSIDWDNALKRLSFVITTAGSAGATVSIMVPWDYQDLGLSAISVNGNPTVFSVEKISGKRIAMISVPVGAHSVVASYGPAVDLGVAVASASVAPVSDTGIYTIVVANTSNTIAPSVSVTVSRSIGFADATISATGWACAVATDSVNCQRSQVGANETAPPIIVSGGLPHVAARVHVSAVVSTSAALIDINPDNDQSDSATDVLVPVSALSVTSSSPTRLTDPTEFSASALGSEVTYTWSFGDGAVGSGATISHTYATASSFVASVVAGNRLGAIEADVIVSVTNAIPIAVPVVAETHPRAGDVVILDGSNSIEPDAHFPLQFQWTQVSGVPVELADPSQVRTSFIAPSERTALQFSLVVTDAFGSTSPPALITVDIYTSAVELYLPAIRR